MDIIGLVTFAAALFVAAASPGPGIAALVARVLGRGTQGAMAFTAGLAVGDVVWLGFAIAGLAALAEAFHWVFLMLKYLGAAYLMYLAWKLWTAPVLPLDTVAEAAAGENRPVRLFATGLAVTMGNPKVMMFYLALLPTLLDITAVSWLGYLELSLVTLAVLAVVFGGYMALATRARRLFKTPRALKLLNRITGGVMGSAAVAIAAR